jgi:uncharacterized repeat protein (TIGR01451 family)
MSKILTKLKAPIALALLGILMGTAFVATSGSLNAAGTVNIESKLEVGNATQKTGPATSVNAKVDDVVNVTVWYHNTELADSGKFAENVNVKINIPGTKTKSHLLTSRVAGANTNVVTDSASVNTSIDTNLNFIPGTATRRYNTGTASTPVWSVQKISDTVVTTGYNIPKINPCWNYQESVNVQVRVTAPVLSITKKVKIEGADQWVTDTTVSPGTTIAYLITVKNEGNTQLTNVIVRDSFPVGLQYVAGSARLINGNYPNGYVLSDKLIDSGVNIGNYGAGSNAYVRFNAKVPANPGQKCGDYEYRNVGVVKSDQLGEYYNTAIVKTNKACVVSKSGLIVIKYHDRDGDKIQDAGEEKLSGWRFRVVGQGVDTILTTNADGVAGIPDVAPGTYTVSEILTSGWTNTTGLSVAKTIKEDSTETFIFGNRKITTPEEPEKPEVPTKKPVVVTPTKLPSSGPLETAGMALGTMSFSGAAVAWAKSKKKLLDSFRK